MDYSSERILAAQREARISHFRGWVLFAVPLAALLYQYYLPLFFPQLAYLEMTLLVTIYFAMMRRSQVNGILVGMVMGIAQDALAGTKIGMFGIAKTLVGYFAASIGLKIDVGQPFVRLISVLIFYLFHQFLVWLLQRALMGQQVGFEWRHNLIVGGLNAVVGLALFHFLDRLKEAD